jgi:beta-glucosidase
VTAVDIEALLAELTLEEKIALCAGKSMWISSSIPRLGIPALKLTDGPNAARGDAMGGVAAACFPVGVALAATWDVELVESVGRALGEEAHTKNAQVLLGPTINLHRHPLGGRNFECYSEDPYLSGTVACAFVAGVQSQGVAACAKHFVCNDSEFERHTISSEVDERTLRELYLKPFEMAVRNAGVWTVMSAYNRINGTYASSSARLLRDLLKGEWGFDGFVVSDWGAALDTVDNARGGLDLEMPGPARTRGPALVEAVRAGEVDEALIDDSVRRILRVTERTGRFAAPDPQPEFAEDRAEHRALARHAAAEAMVLVKNEAVLPFEPDRVKRLAVIGPNAARGQIQGGGSSAVVPHYRSDPLTALTAAFEAVDYAEGCAIHKYLPAPAAEQLTAEPDGGPGLQLRLFDNLDGHGTPVAERTVTLTNTPWGFTPLGLSRGGSMFDRSRFSAVLEGWLHAGEDGAHQIGMLSSGLTRLYLDDELLIDNWTEQQRGDALFGFGSTEKRAAVDLTAAAPRRLRIEFRSQPGNMLQGLRLGLLPPQPADPIAAAVDVAASADAVVIVAGSNPDWETEGNDRTSLALPGDQNELIRRVLAANPNTAVVLNTGAAVSMPWFDAAPCVLQAWLPGQEFGNALTDVICGTVNPCGRMPTTFPIRLEDTPAFDHYPGAGGRVHYREGLLMGYRWYDTREVAPLVPFGHGLSYTTFDYGPPTATLDGDGVAITLALCNRGPRAGHEVVQVYRRAGGEGAGRPLQELCAFAKVAVPAGETRTVTLRVPAINLRIWDDAGGSWRPLSGPVTFAVGASSRDLRHVVEVELA